MKAIFCNNFLPGQILFRSEVMESFHKRGWEVVVVVPKSSATSTLMQGINPEWKMYLLDIDCNSTNPIGDIKYFKQLKEIYRKEKPDIIFHYTIKPNIYGTLAARSAGVKSVAMLAGLGYMFDGDSATKHLGRLLYRYSLHKADKVLVLNSANRDVLLNGNYVKPENLILLPGGEGVNLQKYPCKPMKFATTRFLMVARVLFDKGYNEFVGAAKIVKQKYPDIRFELLGPLATDSPMGVPEEQIKEDCRNGYIDYLGATDKVTDFVLKDDVVMVVPSKYLEGLNRSLMEACAMGRPIITTDIPGCRETVDEGVNGFLAKPNNPQSLADAMLKFLSLNREEKISMAEASHRKAVEIFDVNNVIDTYHKITGELLGIH